MALPDYLDPEYSKHSMTQMATMPRPGYEWDADAKNWLPIHGAPGLTGKEKPSDWVAGNTLVKQEPTKVQIGGEHYKKLAIQPIEYITANNIGFCEGNVIKYVTRWKDKNGIEDLQKAKHMIDLLIGLHNVK